MEYIAEGIYLHIPFQGLLVLPTLFFLGHLFLPKFRIFISSVCSIHGLILIGFSLLSLWIFLKYWFAENDETLSNVYGAYAFSKHYSGVYGLLWGIYLAMAVIIPQILWSTKLRKNTLVILLVSACFYFSLFVKQYILWLYIQSLPDHLPSSWKASNNIRLDFRGFLLLIAVYVLVILIRRDNNNKIKINHFAP